MKKRFFGMILTLCMFLALGLTLNLRSASAIDGSPEVQWGIASASGGEPTVWEGNGSMAEAVAYANGLSGERAYIQLLSDVETDTITFTQGTTTLDLNGNTLISRNFNRVITLNDGILTIADSGKDKNGTISSDSDKSTRTEGIICVSGGSLVVENGTIIRDNQNANESAINVSSGNVIINGGKVVSKRSNYGITISSQGTVTVNGGSVENNDDGWAIVNSGTLIINGGEVIAKLRDTINNGGTLNMTGGKVYNVSTSGYEWHAINNISNATISGGEVMGRYGIRALKGTLTVDGGTITSTDGHAIVVTSNSTIRVNNGHITANKSAIFIDGNATGSIEVTGGLVESIGYTSAIHHLGTGKLTIGGNAVITATGENEGYSYSTVAVYYDTSFEINGGTIENKSTIPTSTAIYVYTGSVNINSKSPIIIKSNGSPINIYPQMIDTVVKTAATNANGIDGVEPFNPLNFSNYKYLEFAPAVAKIGSAGYLTVQEAVDAVENNQTITLLQDIKEEIVVPDDFEHNFTLDLNGKTLSSDNTVITLNGGTMKIVDSTVVKNGAISSEMVDAGYFTSNTEGVINVNGGNFIVENGFIRNNNTNSTVRAFAIKISSGSVYINGGQANGYNAISLENDGNLIVNDGYITADGCAIMIQDGSTGSFNMYGGTITGSGLAIKVQENSFSTITVTGGSLISSWSPLVIQHSGKGKLTIGGTAVVTGGDIMTFGKGAIWIEYSAQLEITGGTIENKMYTNEEIYAIYVEDGSITINSTSTTIIKSKSRLLNKAPILIKTAVKKAATDVNGIDGVQLYNPNNIDDYKYLELVEGYNVTYLRGT